MRTIIRLQKNCNVAGRTLDLDITVMYQQLNEKIFCYHKFKKTAAISRATFQDTRIEELALAGNSDASAVCLKIENLEASGSQNRPTKSALGQNRETGVTRVDIVDSTTAQTISLRRKADIEQANIKYHPELFLYADDNPSRQPDMIAEFEFTEGTTNSRHKTT